MAILADGVQRRARRDYVGDVSGAWLGHQYSVPFQSRPDCCKELEPVPELLLICVLPDAPGASAARRQNSGPRVCEGKGIFHAHPWIPARRRPYRPSPAPAVQDIRVARGSLVNYSSPTVKQRPPLARCQPDGVDSRGMAEPPSDAQPGSAGAESCVRVISAVGEDLPSKASSPARGAL